MNRTRRQVKRTPEVLLKYSRVRGILSWKDRDLPFTGTITITSDGTIRITTHRFRVTDGTAWIFKRVPEKGRLATWVKLRGRTLDGLELESDYVTFSGRDDRIGRTATLALHGELSQLTVRYLAVPTVAANCRLVYHTIGMLGFAKQEANTSLGVICLAGVSDIQDYDHLAGRIQITAHGHEQRSVEDWATMSDDQIANILLIISLAEGKLLEWSVRESAANGTVFRRDFYGPRRTGTPSDGIFHWLNLQPVLDLAVSKYNEELRRTTGIELAIKLLLAQPVHVELQLIAAMTALEHLISVYAKNKPIPSPLPKSVFGHIRNALERAYDAATIEHGKNDALHHGLRRVKERIGNINHTTVKDSLFAMLRDYEVPLAGIQTQIANAVDARHDIIHTGRHNADFAEFYLHVAVLRELLKRIILTLLQYDGEYISFLNGQEFLRFPPVDVAVAL